MWCDEFLNFGEKTALVIDDKSYTYWQLVQKIDELCFKFKDFKGEVVAILGDYSFEAVATFFALFKNKNIIVPITNNIKKEIENRLNESFCKVVIDPLNDFKFEKLEQSKTHDMIEKLKVLNHSGLVLFSSGSTGKPKAMIHDLDKLISCFEGKKQKSLNMLVFLMFDHIGGINTLLNILSAGATAIIPKSREPEYICKLISKFKISVLPSSPSFLNLILISGAYLKYDVSSLRMITYGTEMMSETLLNRLKEAFKNVKFLQTFGTSETGIASVSSKSSSSTFMRIDGENLEYKIVDNELFIRSKTQVMGYLNASMDNFTDDGWFKTGDLVQSDNDGYIRIIGRAKEVINVGGQKVLPSEVENIIYELDEIKDVVVIAQNSPILGQMVVANVSIKDEFIGKESEIKTKLLKHCRAKLDRYKVPSKVVFSQNIAVSDRFKKKRMFAKV